MSGTGHTSAEVAGICANTSNLLATLYQRLTANGMVTGPANAAALQSALADAQSSCSIGASPAGQSLSATQLADLAADFAAFGNQIAAALFTLGAGPLSIASGSYNASTGLVTLQLSQTVNLSPGASITVGSVTGSGSFASVDGTFTCGAGTGGSTVTFTIGTGLTLAITGGAVALNLPWP